MGKFGNQHDDFNDGDGDGYEDDDDEKVWESSVGTFESRLLGFLLHSLPILILSIVIVMAMMMMMVKLPRDLVCCPSRRQSLPSS